MEALLFYLRLFTKLFCNKSYVEIIDTICLKSFITFA